MDASVFADLSLEELRAWRGELVAALRKASTGRTIVSVWEGDTRTQYDPGPNQAGEIRRDLQTITAVIAARERGTGGQHRPIYLGLG